MAVTDLVRPAPPRSSAPRHLAEPAVPPRRSEHRRDIQGLRGIAVLGVVLFHAGLPVITGGYAGVDVFFVISGFLITSHLLRRPVGQMVRGLPGFYAKRARRILPAALLVIIGTLVASYFMLPPLGLYRTLVEAKWTALYAPNVYFASVGTNYLAETTPSLFQHYWSLGIEEQFYLVWPLLLALVLVIARGRPRLVIGLVGAIVLVSFAAGLVLTRTNQPLAFFLLPTRAWELGAGGLVALLVLRGHTLPARIAPIAAWLGLAGILGAFFVFDSGTQFPGKAAAVPVLSAALLIWAGSSSSRRGPLAVLGVAPLQWLGEVSYSLYLVHWPALILPLAATGFSEPLPLPVNLAIVAGCLGAAWVLNRLVETPFRALPVLVRGRTARTLVPALAVSGAIAVVCAVTAPAVAQMPLTSDRPAPAPKAVRSPVGTDYVPSNIHPSLRDALADVPVLYNDGCHADYDQNDANPCFFGEKGKPVVALFGDSHAAQWFPALRVWAERSGYRLETLTKSACPPVDTTVSHDDGPYTTCDQWRKQAVAVLREQRPRMILLAGDSNTPLLGSSDWSGGWRRTIAALKDRSTVAVIGDTPRMGEIAATCLSKNLDAARSCGRSAQAAEAGSTRTDERQAAQRSGVPFIDMNPYLCSSFCPVVIGNELVYRDQHHVTSTFSRTLEPVLGAAVDSAMRE